MKAKKFKIPANMKKMIYFSYAWPRNNYSAACERSIKFYELFLKNNYFCEFITPSNKRKHISENLNHLFSRTLTIDNNNKNEMEIFLNKKKNLEFSVFDTFLAEEFYSFYIHENFPECLKILDTQDLHSIRKIREKKYFDFLENKDIEDIKISEILKIDKIDEKESLFSRELSSIFRSDLVFLTSDFEYRFLTQNYNLKNLYLSRFIYDPDDFNNNELNLDQRNFEKRKNFVWIGNFQHKPNFEAVKLLKEKIWPLIRKKLPKAELHIYGANFPKDFEDIEKIPGIKKKNLMPNLKRLQKYKALLAPIFFGGGIKGKITDSWFNSLPVVTTLAGSEGLYYESYENDYSLNKNKMEKKDERFFKPDSEIGKSKNNKIDFLYNYEFENKNFVNENKNLDKENKNLDNENFNKEHFDLKFGGSFFNDGFLIRYF